MRGKDHTFEKRSSNVQNELGRYECVRRQTILHLFRTIYSIITINN